MFNNFDFYNTVILIILLFTSFSTTYYFQKTYRLNSTLCYSIFVFHNIIFLFYLIFQFTIGSDNLTYFLDYQEIFIYEVQSGVPFLKFFIQFISYLKINYVNINYIFSIISLIGIFFLLDIFNKIETKNNVKFLLLLFFFIPSFHFWISGFSKDTITFFCISYKVHFFFNIENKKLLQIDLILILIILGFTRIHILAMVLLSITISYSFLKNSKAIKSIPITSFFLILLYLSLSYLLKGPANFEDIIRYISFFDNLYVDDIYTTIETQNFFLVRVIEYLFGPNIFYNQNNTFLYSYLSLENTFLVIIFLFLMNKNIFKKRCFKKFSLMFFLCLIFFVLLTLVTSNLGISNRQKWMILPTLFLLFSHTKFYIEKKSKHKKYENT